MLALQDKKGKKKPELFSFVMIKASRFFMIFIFSLILFTIRKKDRKRKKCKKTIRLFL